MSDGSIIAADPCVQPSEQATAASNSRAIRGIWCITVLRSWSPSPVTRLVIVPEAAGNDTGSHEQCFLLSSIFWLRPNTKDTHALSNSRKDGLESLRHRLWRLGHWRAVGAGRAADGARHR